MAIALEYRVGNLEAAMAEMARQVARTSQEVERTSREMREAAARSEREMRKVKDEVRAHRDGSEHAGRKSYLQADDEIIKIRRRWGERARKIGRMVDYLVEPVLPDIFRQFVNCPEDEFESSVYLKCRNTIDPTLVGDFDMVVSNDEYALINKTRNDLTPDSISEFVALLGRVREFIPRFADKKVIGAIGSLYVDPSLVTCGERYGLIVLGFGDDVMQVLNSAGFKPKEF